MSCKQVAVIAVSILLAALAVSCAPGDGAKAPIGPIHSLGMSDAKAKLFAAKSFGAMPLIGQPAPAFRADTTLGPVNFPAAYRGRWVVFFSHPGDFTPVCTTEFMAFARMTDDFSAINCKLLGLSVDSKPSHIAWLFAIEEKIEYKGMKKVVVRFPVVSDTKMEVAKLYGMIHPHSDDTRAVRAAFVIDPNGIIRAILCYPSTTGRNVSEILRLVIALQTSDEHLCATGADWQPGDDVILPLPGTCNKAAERITSAGEGYRCLDWFFCLKKLAKEHLTLPPRMK
jgi:peroxiredoxin (alkyl hydroperoxide reductase subunit C)